MIKENDRLIPDPRTRKKRIYARHRDLSRNNIEKICRVVSFSNANSLDEEHREEIAIRKRIGWDEKRLERWFRNAFKMKRRSAILFRQSGNRHSDRHAKRYAVMYRRYKGGCKSWNEREMKIISGMEEIERGLTYDPVDFFGYDSAYVFREGALVPKSGWAKNLASIYILRYEPWQLNHYSSDSVVTPHDVHTLIEFKSKDQHHPTSKRQIVLNGYRKIYESEGIPKDRTRYQYSNEFAYDLSSLHDDKGIVLMAVDDSKNTTGPTWYLLRNSVNVSFKDTRLISSYELISQKTKCVYLYEEPDNGEIVYVGVATDAIRRPFAKHEISDEPVNDYKIWIGTTSGPASYTDIEDVLIAFFDPIGNKQFHPNDSLLRVDSIVVGDDNITVNCRDGRNETKMVPVVRSRGTKMTFIRKGEKTKPKGLVQYK